ncbi:MAG: CoA ester lyase [Thermodesulfobacteriota bacterium]|nr:CoA ester lyase [Thermodesulfobacteriota bacterium]
MERILRTMLFVPANSWRMITTATTEGGDAVILDLEDACPIAEKETGRIFARDSIPMLKEKGMDVFVRVNSFDTELTEEDISYVVVSGLDGVMLPKAESKEDILNLDQLLKVEEEKKGILSNTIAILPLLESPKGISAVSEIISGSQRVIGVSFGAGDYSREIGAGMGVTSLSPEEYFLMASHPRSCIALAARAAGILAIDSPFFGLVIDIEGLIKESRKVKLIGFTGKLLVHPRHVDSVNQVFSPSKDEIDFARRVIKAYEEAKAKGLGATSLGGRMIDYGSYRRALNLISIAEKISEREKRKNQ